MTCQDCGRDVAATEVPAGMATCCRCRKRQVERMPEVEASLPPPRRWLVQVQHPFNCYEVQRSMRKGSLRETGDRQ